MGNLHGASRDSSNVVLRLESFGGNVDGVNCAVWLRVGAM
jgi:hypothetical protein